MAEQSASERHGVSTPRVVERGPGSSGRYLRYDTILGRGAFKTVYKGFDEREGIEVAWNQIKSNDIVREGERLTTEINVLKNMKHKNVMYFYESWVDRESGTVNFITELFTSGTLRQYRQKHKNLNKNALKRWAWQILQGLVYLHGHDPPIIHRDLKCDNIFVNGSAGVVKIGDLGLATLLRGTTAPQSCLGTPEFMAPELYEERYNEKVDVYGFGMCMLELATMQYPYSECVNAAQIYKRVSQGRYPEGLKAVEDDELREFIQLCISHASDARPEARRLLKHSFFEDIRKSAQAANEERAIEKAATGDLAKDRASLAGSSGSGLSEQSHSGSVEEVAAREESAAASAALLTDAIKEVYVSAEVQGNNRSHSGFGRVVSMEVGNLPQPNGEKCNIEFSFELGVDSVKDIIHEMQAELNLDLADIDAHVIEEKIDVELQKVMGDGLRSWSSLLTSAGSCRAQAELEAQGDRSSFTLSPQLTSSLRHSTAAGLDDLGLGDAPPPVFHPTDVSAFESTRGTAYSRAGAGDAQSRVSSNEGFTFAPRPSEFDSSTQCSVPEAPPRSSTSASPPPGRGTSGTERHGLSPPRISSTSSVAHDGRHESDTISGARKDKLSFREIRSCIDQAHAAGLLHGTRA